MEKTVVFYGRYSATHLDGALSNYDLKLAYMLVIIAYFVISLIYMVHQYVLYQYVTWSTSRTVSMGHMVHQYVLSMCLICMVHQYVLYQCSSSDLSDM